jgi:hypothetical protein
MKLNKREKMVLKNIVADLYMAKSSLRDIQYAIDEKLTFKLEDGKERNVSDSLMTQEIRVEVAMETIEKLLKEEN